MFIAGIVRERSDGLPHNPCGLDAWAEGAGRRHGDGQAGRRRACARPAASPSWPRSFRRPVLAPPLPHPHAFVGRLRYARVMAKELPLVAVAMVNLIESGDSRIKALKNAGAVGTTVCSLAIAARKLDHWPTQTEYAAYWKISERKAQQEWALFRRAFPGEESPDRIARWLHNELGRRVEEKTAPLTVPAPPDLVLATA
jgi:hypothetical protein